MNNKRFSVKFSVKSIVQYKVDADNYEDAVEQALEFMKKSPVYVKGLEVLDTHESLCGWDDNDLWNEIQ